MYDIPRVIAFTNSQKILETHIHLLNKCYIYILSTQRNNILMHKIYQEITREKERAEGITK